MANQKELNRLHAVRDRQKEVDRLEKVRDQELEEACGEHLLSDGFADMYHTAHNEKKDPLLLAMLDESMNKYSKSSEEHLDKAVEAEIRRMSLIHG